MSKFSRREIVGAALAASVAAGVRPARAGQSPAGGRIRADVCVVGAGYAGLAAAWRLRKAGASVVVLEARDRVGGRSHSVPMNGGGWLDLGAQWVGPTQDRFLALIREMGCETYRSPKFGKTLQLGILDPRRFDRIEGEGDTDYPGAPLVNTAFARLDALAARLVAETPWTYPDAARLDAMTFAEWLRQTIPNQNARAFVSAEVCSLACASPEEISLLHLLFLIKACKGLDMLFGDEGGAQQDRVIGGTQSVALRLAARLAGVVRHGEPVRRIEWSDAGAVVHSDRTSIAARHVVVAIPPNLASAIEYAPSLPIARVQVTQRWPQGVVIKLQVVYREPFWRKLGLNGISYDYLSPLGETADGGVPERYSNAGILTGFVYAAHARRLALLPPMERRTLLLREAARRFGPKALEPVTYHEVHWSTQQWTRGCFTGFLTPGATVLFRNAVRDPVGSLHFAGTETATVWPSFIDGAIRSGERAADAVRRRAG